MKAGYSSYVSCFPPLSNLTRPCDRARLVRGAPRASSHVRTLHARCPPRGRAWAASGRSRPRLQAAARQAAGGAARPGSGHQGGPQGAGGAEGRERGCQGRRYRPTRCRGRRAARCRGGRRAFAGGAEPRLHRLLPAAVRHGRRSGEASHL
eukprot:scaffold115333_cov57-Phaeocystis_antarctica.AAC.1